MSKGILVHAFNNEQIDYVKQAVSLAKRAQTHLNLPVSIITDCDVPDIFDNVIKISKDRYTQKIYNNGSHAQRLTFKNNSRVLSYELTPYDQTLMLDTDVIICDNTFKQCFAQQKDLLLYKDAYDLAQTRNYNEFDKISETSVDFYWATCVYFTKSKTNEIFFNLLKHIEENWQHYRMAYQILNQTYRNDFAFSIAIHIMNGHSKGDFVGHMPGKLFYTTDRDILVDINENQLTFLLEDSNNKYFPMKTNDITVHAMNKFSLEELL